MSRLYVQCIPEKYIKVFLKDLLNKSFINTLVGSILERYLICLKSKLWTFPTTLFEGIEKKLFVEKDFSFKISGLLVHF